MGISIVKHEHEVTYAGDIVVPMSTGQSIKIETSPDGEELLDWTAPEPYEALIVVWFRKKAT